MNYLWGLGGIIFVLFLAYLLSVDRKAIQWRPVVGAFIIQLLFAFIVLKWSAGRFILEKISAAVSTLIDYAGEGVTFLFGSAIPEGGFVFAFQVLTVIIFLSAVISVLYYFGIMQFLIRIIGGSIAKLLGTSQTESMSAAANIFLSQTEAPLLIRPYIPKITTSELFAIMVGGLSSVAGSVLVGYALMGVPLEYLIAASFMAAPAGLLMAKLVYPQRDKVLEETKVTFESQDAVNVVDAAARGAADGLGLALNIGAMLLAFVSIIALLNGIIGGIFGIFGVEGLTLEGILGYIFSPIAFIIGVPFEEALRAGSFIGQKFLLNEFVAFSSFSPVIPELSSKTVAVVSFALCGFANISSLAILIGGIGGMAPSRRHEVARLGFRAVLAGTLANLLSAAIAGMFL